MYYTAAYGLSAVTMGPYACRSCQYALVMTFMSAEDIHEISSIEVILRQPETKGYGI